MYMYIHVPHRLTVKPTDQLDRQVNNWPGVLYGCLIKLVDQLAWLTNRSVVHGLLNQLINQLTRLTHSPYFPQIISLTLRGQQAFFGQIYKFHVNVYVSILNDGCCYCLSQSFLVFFCQRCKVC